MSGDANKATETIQGEFGAIQFVLYGQSNNGTTSVSSAGGWSQVTNSPVTIPGIGTVRDVKKRRDSPRGRGGSIGPRGRVEFQAPPRPPARGGLRGGAGDA